MNPIAGRFRGLLAQPGTALVALSLMAPLAALAELSNGSMLGPGLRWRPAYDGSSSQRTELVPVVRYFGRPWFVRSTQGVLEGGARAELAEGLHAGVQLAYEAGRDPGQSAFLRDHGVSGISGGASAGAHLEWDHKIGPVPFTLLARARRHVDAARGTQVDLRASVGVFQSGPFAAGVFTQATWANANAAAFYYSITPQQSAALRLPAFEAGSGWQYGSLGLLWSVDLARDWIVVGSIEARRLQGDVAKSPLTERTTNHYVSAGVAYRF